MVESVVIVTTPVANPTTWRFALGWVGSVGCVPKSLGILNFHKCRFCVPFWSSACVPVLVGGHLTLMELL